MEYGIIFILIFVVSVAFSEISKLEKRIKLQQKQIDELCRMTGNINLSSDFISDEAIERARCLKNEGKKVAAVKEIRKCSSMGLVEAKQFMDKL